MSDESLNASSTSAGVTTFTSSGISKSSTLGTVMEGSGEHARVRSPFLDDDAWVSGDLY